MIKGEDVKKTSEITLGTAYDINKDLVQKYEKTLTDEELQQKRELIAQYILEVKQFYFMLLCHEQRDYTLFNLNNESDYEKGLKTATELIECLNNRGQIKGIDKTKDNMAIEIWISNENESFAYYFFGYDEGVIEIGGING